MPEQVGAWLAHEQVWRHVENEGLTLVCEDDIRFTARVSAAFSFLGRHRELSRAVETGPVLLRLGRALSSDHESDRGFQLTNAVTMSNPCYALNRSMAGRLLSSSDRISTTVDIFVHREMGPEATSLTLDPPLASELSWSTGALRSDVLPKRRHIEYLKQHLQALDASDPEANDIAEQIRQEEARFESFIRYNREGSGD